MELPPLNWRAQRRLAAETSTDSLLVLLREVALVTGPGYESGSAD